MAIESVTQLRKNFTHVCRHTAKGKTGVVTIFLIDTEAAVLDSHTLYCLVTDRTWMTSAGDTLQTIFCVYIRVGYMLVVAAICVATMSRSSEYRYSSTV